MTGDSGASSQTDDIDDLLAIFTIRTMRDLKKHCRTATISKAHLANFIGWCRSSADAPFLYAAHHRHFHPEHLTLSDTDLAALAENCVGKFKPAAHAQDFVLPDLSEWPVTISRLPQAQWHYHRATLAPDGLR
jgi:hypothetical protein